MGFGLTISSKLAGLIGPYEKIILVSKINEGTEFSFYIFKNIFNEKHITNSSYCL